VTAARRLAAILAADVVGYSRLMGEDEAGTARLVRERARRRRRLSALSADRGASCASTKRLGGKIARISIFSKILSSTHRYLPALLGSFPR
jgi:hypothetical protein